MPSNVTCYFATTGGVADMDCILQVKHFGERRKIVGVSVHLVSVPGLGGTAVSTAIMRNHSKATLAEEQHLRIPVVRAKRPTVTEHDGLARSPILVEDLCTVFCGNRWHKILSSVGIALRELREQTEMP